MEKIRKKANVFDTAQISIWLFAGAIVVIIGAFAWNQISPQLSENLDSAVAQNVISTADTVFPYFDYVYLGLVIGLIIFVVMSAIMVRTHPIFFVVSIIVLAIVGLITPQMSNSFSEFRQQEAINATSMDFPIVNYTMENLPIIICVIGIVAIIFLYGKPKGEGNVTF